MDIFPSRLKATRKAKRYTQRELSGLVGMDQDHISRLEIGGKGVSIEHIQALARELGVTVSHLLVKTLWRSLVITKQPGNEHRLYPITMRPMD